MLKREKGSFYDSDIDYDSLEQATYDDTPGCIFYKCPRCGREYLAEFITEEDGLVMCIDCWGRRNH